MPSLKPLPPQYLPLPLRLPRHRWQTKHWPSPTGLTSTRPALGPLPNQIHALLGNVLHFQQGYEKAMAKPLLYNANNELTEASACNVFIVKDNRVITPLLDNQKLAGITRHIVLGTLRSDGNIPLKSAWLPWTKWQSADEVWITSSSKEIAPVTR